MLIHSLTLHKLYTRTSNVTLSELEKQQIRENTTNLTEEQIIQYCIRHTAQKLTFSKHNQLSKGKANCVGYSSLGCAVLNYAFTVHNIKNKATHVVGYVYCGEINLNKILMLIYPNTGFVKDHDFIELNDCYIDPCIYDYLGNSCKTSKR